MPDRGHVFIVDHHERSAKILRTILENNGYAVDSATSGTEALATIPGAEPNL